MRKGHTLLSKYTILFASFLLFACQPKNSVVLNGYKSADKGNLGSNGSLEFDPISVNLTATKTATLSNHGGWPLTIKELSSLSASGPFSYDSDSTCGEDTRLEPDETCDIVVSFSPLSVGTFGENITVTFETDNWSGSYQLVLQGTGDLTVGLTVNQSGPQADPAAALPISYDVRFSTPINAATFTDADITQNGTATGVTWTITNSGDNQNFTLTADTVVTEGTIVPSVAAGLVLAADTRSFIASSSSDNSVFLDTVAPVDNVATLKFTDVSDNDGSNLRITWTAFADDNLSDHRLITYTDAACTTGAEDHGLTGSDTNSNDSIVDGLSAGTYWAKVAGVDVAGNETLSACSADSIIVDLATPSLSSIVRKVGESNPSTGTSFVYTVTFSEDVSTLAAGDFTLVTTSGSVYGTVATITPVSGSVYDVTVTWVSGYGDLRLDLNDSDSSLEDVVGRKLATTYVSGSQSFTKLPPPFITSWDTTLPGSANNTIVLPLVSGSTYDFVVDWGDGTQDHITAWNAPAKTHVYAVAGIKTVKMYGVFGRFAFENADDKEKLLDVLYWGPNRWTSMKSAFYGCTNLTTFSAPDVPNFTSVTNMSEMFRGATSFNDDLNNWSVSNVTDMSYIFAGATDFNGDITGWNTGKVTTFASAFAGTATFNRNIGGWNTASATSMKSMFEGAVFNQSIGSWNTSKVTNMSAMFKSNVAFNKAVKAWSTRSVTDMSSMFHGATAFNQLISTWDTSKVTTMNDMFNGASAFNQDLSGWNVSNVATHLNFKTEPAYVLSEPDFP